jgi:hypothetical protein
MKGYAYDFLAILHAVTVIFTMLWLPFGKFFHIFQRPAQMGVSFYKDVGTRGAGGCRRCGAAFTSRMHVDDLIAVQKALASIRGRRSRRALPVDLSGAVPARSWRSCRVGLGRELRPGCLAILRRLRHSPIRLAAARSAARTVPTSTPRKLHGPDPGCPSTSSSARTASLGRHWPAP